VAPAARLITDFCNPHGQLGLEYLAGGNLVRELTVVIMDG